VWRDPSEIKRRDWLYATHYIRKFVGCTIGRRGHGKTTRAIAEMLSMVTGRDLLKTGKMPDQKLRVWYIGEDPREEIERRIIAACAHYGIRPDEIEGRLFFDSVFSLPPGATKVVILKNNAAARQQLAIDALMSGIKGGEVDVLIIDPLKKFHAVPENSNDHMDEVMVVFSEIAAQTNAAIEILHHTRKPSASNNGNPMTVDDGRGADAIVAAARSARIINVMTLTDSEKFGIEVTKAWSYIRIDNGKANMAPPEAAVWAHLWSEILPCGESVGVAQPWKTPNAFDGMTSADMWKWRKVVHIALTIRPKIGSATPSLRYSGSMLGTARTTRKPI
jgi:RecA-family ATPase